MTRKLIVIDLDGTLLSHFKRIPLRNKNAVIQAQKEGHIVMIATGRPLETSIEYAREIEIDKYSGLVASYNGSVLTDIKNGEELVNIKFELDLLRRIISFIDELEVDYSVMRNNVLYTNEHSKFLVRLYRMLAGQSVVKNRQFSDRIDFTANKVLLNDTKKHLRVTKKLLEEKFGDDINISFSSPVSLEVTPIGASKGDVLINVAKEYGIDIKDTIAIGNTGNDESMIKVAGTGVAMKNGSKSLKSIADVITGKNYQSGVGEFIEKYVLKGK